MWRLIRLAVFVMIAFTAGILYERNYQKERCGNAGGTWSSARFCEGWTE
ncbi:hypothetical protein RR11_3443 [Ruegeria sp. R11]|jgi:hypothetical protein|nr:hypothetical protein [Phaeobacter italicus]EEB72680.1 hypothetical protein RR11_3443 [Ruegeria sp. R11]MCI5100254.1 hypothetical protein [Phaeobacter italicus]MEC8015074.1 hypothetical protein [Pseudomonadota bacterium]MEC8575492.1 hypothetical protein [Pseudomonadota bacterium]